MSCDDCLFNNPCGHSGIESFVCEECGYPDPRKTIAALREELSVEKKQNSMLQEEVCACWEKIGLLTKERDELREKVESALKYIKEWGNWRTSAVDIKGIKQILMGEMGT